MYFTGNPPPARPFFTHLFHCGCGDRGKLKNCNLLNISWNDLTAPALLSSWRGDFFLFSVDVFALPCCKTKSPNSILYSTQLRICFKLNACMQNICKRYMYTYFYIDICLYVCMYLFDKFGTLNLRISSHCWGFFCQVRICSWLSGNNPKKPWHIIFQKWFYAVCAHVLYIFEICPNNDSWNSGNPWGLWNCIRPVLLETTFDMI